MPWSLQTLQEILFAMEMVDSAMGISDVLYVMIKPVSQVPNSTPAIAPSLPGVLHAGGQAIAGGGSGGAAVVAVVPVVSQGNSEKEMISSGGGAASGGRVRRAQNDWPMYTKMFLLLSLALAVGCGFGICVSSYQLAPWTLLTGLCVLLLALGWLGQYLICDPVESLIALAENLVRERSPGDMKLLPVHRHDEIGRLATSVHELCRLTIRDHHEARNLRATLDYRIAQATQEAVKHLTQLTMRDSLTGLGNRRFMDEHLEQLVRCVREAGSDLACVIIDMDNFKQVNDMLGHATGDGLLIMAAQIFRASCRREDYVIRLGGDEFVIFMPGCSPARAAANFERMRQLFRNQARATLPLTVQPDLSAGMAWLQRDGARNGTELLKKADVNLYAAKRAGKGRAVAG